MDRRPSKEGADGPNRANQQEKRPITFGDRQMLQWQQEQRNREPDFLSGKGTDSEAYRLAKAYRAYRSNPERFWDNHNRPRKSIRKGELVSQMLDKCQQSYQQLSNLAQNDSLAREALTMSGKELQEDLDQIMSLAQHSASLTRLEPSMSARIVKAAKGTNWQSPLKEVGFNVLAACLDRFQYRQWRIDKAKQAKNENASFPDKNSLDEKLLNTAFETLQSDKKDIRAILVIHEEISQRLRKDKHSSELVAEELKKKYDQKYKFLVSMLMLRKDRHLSSHTWEDINNASKEFADVAREIIRVIKPVKEIKNDFQKLVNEIDQENGQKLQLMISKLPLEESSKYITEYCLDRLAIFDWLRKPEDQSGSSEQAQRNLDSHEQEQPQAIDQLRKPEDQSDLSEQAQRNLDSHEQEQFQAKEEAMMRLCKIQRFSAYLKTLADSLSSTDSSGLPDQSQMDIEQLKQQFQIVYRSILSKYDTSQTDKMYFFDKMEKSFGQVIRAIDNIVEKGNHAHLNEKERYRQNYYQERILELQKYAHYYLMWLKKYQERLGSTHQSSTFPEVHEQFARRFPDAAKLIQNSPPAMQLVQEAAQAGAVFGRYTKDRPFKMSYTHSAEDHVYIEDSIDPPKTVLRFLYELANTLNKLQFREVVKMAVEGKIITGEDYAYRKALIEVEATLRTGEIWSHMTEASNNPEWRQPHLWMEASRYQAYKKGTMSKHDIAIEAMEKCFVGEKTYKQFYIDQFENIRKYRYWYRIFG